MFGVACCKQACKAVDRADIAFNVAENREQVTLQHLAFDAVLFKDNFAMPCNNLALCANDTSFALTSFAKSGHCKSARHAVLKQHVYFLMVAHVVVVEENALAVVARSQNLTLFLASGVGLAKNRCGHIFDELCLEHVVGYVKGLCIIRTLVLALASLHTKLCGAFWSVVFVEVKQIAVAVHRHGLCPCKPIYEVKIVATLCKD